MVFLSPKDECKGFDSKGSLWIIVRDFATQGKQSIFAKKQGDIYRASRLAFYNPGMRFVTEPGASTFSTGRSSNDIQSEETVTLGGPVVEYRQREIVDTKVAVI